MNSKTHYRPLQDGLQSTPNNYYFSTYYTLKVSDIINMIVKRVSIWK